jgi:hypothetical protein
VDKSRNPRSRARPRRARIGVRVLHSLEFRSPRSQVAAASPGPRAQLTGPRCAAAVPTPRPLQGGGHWRTRPRPSALANSRPCRPLRGRCPAGGCGRLAGGGRGGPARAGGRGRRLLLRRSWVAAWERARRSRPRRRGSRACPGPGREGGRRQAGRALRRAQCRWLLPGCVSNRRGRDEAPLRGDDLRKRHGRDHRRGQ